MPRNKVLVVDDDVPIRFGITRFLQAKGYEVSECGSCAGARDQIRRAAPDVAIVDYALPDGDAFDLLSEFRASAPGSAVVVLTAHGSIDLAVKALQSGAAHFLTKPVDLPALHVMIERLIENQRNRQTTLAVQQDHRYKSIDPFAGSSAAIRRVAEQVQRLRATETPILIQGETGTGKGILADWIHRNSVRAEEPFVDLNCAGLSRDLLETELFGHEKGAFTGATQTKEGLLEIADRGTVFLDEIGDMDLQVQPKLLKVLEEQRFRRVGDTRDRTVDVRLISATHEELTHLVSERRFRSDLFFRISTVVIHLPLLRDRLEDIPSLASALIARLRPGSRTVEISDAALELMQGYAWPGNVRELRNVIEGALLLAEDGIIRPEQLQFHFALRTPAAPTYDYGEATLAQIERAHIVRVLADEHNSVDRAARRLGVARNTLYYKLKKHRIALGRRDAGSD